MNRSRFDLHLHRYFRAVVASDSYHHERRASSEWDVPNTRPLAEKVTRLLEHLLGSLDRSGKGVLTVAALKSWN